VRIASLTFMAGVTLCTPLLSQGQPGTNLSVDVAVVSVARSSDTTRVDYIVSNSASSQEQLASLTIDAPSEPFAITIPSPPESWLTASRYGERTVVRWAVIDESTLRPGTQSPVLSFKAVGLSTIVDAYIKGSYELPPMSEDEIDSLSSRDPLSVRVKQRVVGVEPIPVATTLTSLTDRLDNLTRQACTLGWIAQGSLCTTLRGHLSAQPARLTSFRDDLTAGHTTGGPVTNNAYWLLKVNAEYILSVDPGQTTPVLTWPPPAPIAFGTALSATQLNASATGVGSGALGGNFSYTPAAGTVLQPGATRPLSVVFTPTDRTAYTTAGASVTIDARYTTTAGHRFLQPINTPPQNRSVFQLGSTVPVKFQLFRADGVTPVTTAVANIQVNKVSNGAPDPVNETVYSTVPDQGTRFRYAGNQYVFNLGTRTLAIGTYRLTALLDDGSTIVQDIELRGN